MFEDRLKQEKKWFKISWSLQVKVYRKPLKYSTKSKQKKLPGGTIIKRAREQNNVKLLSNVDLAVLLVIILSLRYPWLGIPEKT